MPESPVSAGPVRSAALVNAEIRGLTAGRTSYSAAELARLRDLQVEWREADARERAFEATLAA